MLGALKEVFSRIPYIIIAVITSTLVLAFAVWLPNFALIFQIVFNSGASLFEKLIFLVSFFGSLQTNFSAISASYTIIIAILFGVNVALLIYYICAKRTSSVSSGASFGIGGLVSGIFGIGCATCGTFILSSFFVIFGAGSVLSILPFGGEEFGFLGVGLLVVSMSLTTRNINKANSCFIT